VAGCGECGDEPSGSCATELFSTLKSILPFLQAKFDTLCNILQNTFFCGNTFLTPLSTPNTDNHSLFSGNYPPYLEAFSSMHRPRTRHAEVTSDPVYTAIFSEHLVLKFIELLCLYLKCTCVFMYFHNSCCPIWTTIIFMLQT
jgi:hypothetical protein